LNNRAANAAQINGATINIHTQLNAQSWNNAGPKLLAGFTEVPVNHSHRRWTKVNDNQITSPATDEFSDFWVAQSTAKTKTKVRIISANNHNQTFQLTQSNPFAHKLSKLPNNTPKINAHRIPQINWATM
jgi:hypothetical protein